MFEVEIESDFLESVYPGSRVSLLQERRLKEEFQVVGLIYLCLSTNNTCFHR